MAVSSREGGRTWDAGCKRECEWQGGSRTQLQVHRNNAWRSLLGCHVFHCLFSACAGSGAHWLCQLPVFRSQGQLHHSMMQAAKQVSTSRHRWPVAACCSRNGCADPCTALSASAVSTKQPLGQPAQVGHGEASTAHHKPAQVVSGSMLQREWLCGPMQAFGSVCNQHSA